MTAVLAVLGLGSLALNGCGSEPPARLEEWIDGAWLEHPVIQYEISGGRDGASTHALATLEFEKSRRLHLDFEVVYNPTPALGEGHWTLEGAGQASGEIVAESVRFVGGQGEGPSIGGRYQLNENGSPRFRVELPLRSVGQPKWQVE
jgi:hypothetical protein